MATGAPPAGGAPNVLLVVLDDVGFAQLGCFGSDIDTPHLDGLAAGGLRYPNFHTTALCSPTRACLLTGRNHHTVGMGRIIRPGHGLPRLRRPHPAIVRPAPAMLTPHGYAAYAVGKWHLTPEDESHLGARRDRWPLGRGFERFYGFFPGETHQFVPPSCTTTTSSSRRAVRGRLPPHRGPRRPRHRVRRGPPQRRRRQALVPLPGHRRLPLAAPGAGRVDRALPRALRRRVGRLAGGAARPPEGLRAAARAHRAVAPARLGAGVGLAVRRRAPRLRPVHGGLRRLPVPHRPPARPPVRPPRRDRRARRHARGRAVRQRGVVGGRPGRLAQRRARGTSCPAASRRPPSASTRSAGPASTTTTRGGGRSRATRRSGAGSGRRTRAAWPTR